MRLLGLITLTCAACLPTLACSQAFPDRPVRILVGFPAGGANDIVTRILGQKLNEIWGQTIVVDNRGGASGNIAADIAAKSNPDGYTLFMTSGSIVTANQHMYKKMTWNAEKDLAAITEVVSGPQLVVVGLGFPAKSIKDFIALAKSRPGSLTFGSAGIGTQTHLAAENLIYTAGIDVVHVPYKGEAPAMVDVIAGQVNFVTANMAASIGFVQQGKLRALGVTSKKRVPPPSLP